MMKKIAILSMLILNFNLNASELILELQNEQINMLRDFVVKVKDRENSKKIEILFEKIKKQKLSKNIELDFSNKKYNFSINYNIYENKNKEKCINVLQKIDKTKWDILIVNEKILNTNKEEIKLFELFDLCSVVKENENIKIKLIKK